MAIEQLSERVFHVPGGVNIGVLRGKGSRYVMIDTGLNETAAKKALKAVREELGGEVTAILTTHAHADHFGGNATVVKRTGAKVYAPVFDEAILRYPLLQPILLFGGADPPASMRGNFMLADASPVDFLIDGPVLTVEDIEVTVVPLKGHSPNQVGFLVDGVFFCADVVLPASVLEKYKIPYLYSVTDHLDALEIARGIEHTVAVPGHGARTDDLPSLIDLNRSLVLEVADQIVELARESVTAETVLTKLLNQYQAQVFDAPAFYLLHPTVYAFLTHLERSGRVRHVVEAGQSLWQAS